MSEHFEMVKDFYNCQLWSEYMVKNAVDRWITATEYQKITGKEYEKE